MRLPYRSVSLQEVVFLLFSFISFWLFNGHTHLFDWDEINFAEAAREMLVTGNYSVVQIDFMPFWEKPPFFIWLQALSMKIFGVNEFAARFPNAVAGLFTLISVYLIGRKLYNRLVGQWWSIFFVVSLLPLFYFKSGIIDPWFNLFIFLSVYFLYDAMHSHKNSNKIMASGFFLGLAVLTKGPAALVLGGLTYGIYQISINFRSFFSVKQWLIFLFSFLICGVSWFLYEWATGYGHIFYEFILYQIRLFTTEDAGHGGPFFYHFVVILVGVFPASVFMIDYFIQRKKYVWDDHWQRMASILLGVTLILFSIVKTKIIHYSSLCYFPVTLFAALRVAQLKEYPAFSRFFYIFSMLWLGVFSLVFFLIAYIERWKMIFLRYVNIKDAFALANFSQSVRWEGDEWIPALMILGAMAAFLFFMRGIRRALYYYLFLLFVGIWLAIVMITPRVEKYSQGAAIDIYRSIVAEERDEDVIIYPYGFKTYAHLFYTGKKKNLSQGEDILSPVYPRKVYIVTKITSEEEFARSYPHFRKWKEHGGFVCWVNTGE